MPMMTGGGEKNALVVDTDEMNRRNGDSMAWECSGWNLETSSGTPQEDSNASRVVVEYE